MLPRLLAPDLPSTRSSRDLLNLFHSDYKPDGLISLFFVTTSSFWHWVICVPAAFLKSGSRFSGSLSGIEPWFPVTRHNHGSPLHYRQKLIGQIFECITIPRVNACEGPSVTQYSSASQRTLADGISYVASKSSLSQGHWHALAAGLPQLFM